VVRLFVIAGAQLFNLSVALKQASRRKYIFRSDRAQSVLLVWGGSGIFAAKVVETGNHPSWRLDKLTRASCPHSQHHLSFTTLPTTHHKRH
jgi:hypothetical protein